MFCNGLIFRVENKEVTYVIVEMRDKCRITEKPVRESGGFNLGYVSGVLIDNGVVVNKDSITVVDKGGGD